MIALSCQGTLIPTDGRSRASQVICSTMDTTSPLGFAGPLGLSLPFEIDNELVADT